MSKSQHGHKDTLIQANQNNQMSEDPRDGSRVSFTAEKEEKTAVEERPEHDRQDQETIEAFGEEGAGLAAKE
jgi:hypothetical protein